MNRSPGMRTAMAIGILLLLSSTASAQLSHLSQVTVLPVSVSTGQSDLADRLTSELRSGLRLSTSQRLSSPEEVTLQLDGRSPGSVLSSISRLVEFSELRGIAFIIGGVANVLDDGSIELSLLLFSREEKAIHAVESAIFPDEGTAIAGIGALAFQLTHPRNYVAADTAFFYSLILPGMGQLNQGEPMRAALSAGLVLAAVLYGIATPSPDPFRLDWESYQAEQIWGTDQYEFTIHDTKVSEEEFYRVLSAARKRNMKAYNQRLAVEKRKKRAGYLFAGAYLFNLIDTIILTRRKVDTGPFFMRLEAVTDSMLPTINPRLQVQLGIRFR
ncbi:hypothetical protein ACFL6T_05445 [Candidatus Zixiibacteriota bacterium]